MMGEMKQTGIRWIGEIPSEWNTKRIKYMATLKGRIGWQGLTSEEYQDEGAFLITGVDFANGGINWEQCEHVPMKRWEEAKDIQIQNGDLLITKDGTVGKVAIVSDMPGETSLNSGVLRIMPIAGYSQRFLYWVLQSEVFWNWFNFKNAGNSTIIHLYQGDFAEFTYTFPEYEEQEIIANYLDEECAKADSIAEIIKKQIESLKSYKLSLITETVTRGLNKASKYKDSGISWIGSIPAHWDIKRIKDINRLQTGTTPSQNIGIVYDRLEDTFCWYTAGDFNDRDYWLYESERCIEKKAVRENNIKLYPKNSVLFVAIGATLGKIGCLREPAYSNQQITALIPNGIDGRFETYYLVSKVQYLKDNALYTTLPIMNNQYLGGVKIVVPPLEEQQSIVDFLDHRCSEIESVIKEKNEQLVSVMEYKKSLIYEYVTGKKRVKEVM